MKKFYLVMMVSLFIIVGKAFAGDDSGFKVKMDDQAHVGLFCAFSGVDSKFEDDNVIIEIYNQVLWLKNKTDKTLYLDLAECFTYIYGEDIPLYVPEKDKKGQSIVTEEQWRTIAPGQLEKIAPMGAALGGTYAAYEGKKLRILNDNTRKFMTTIDEMRMDLEKGVNSVTRHFTKDEAFITLKAALSYRFSRKAEQSTSVVVETWLSDLILSKYFTLLPPQQKKERSLAAKEVKPAMVCVGADQPFEYEEEKSPILSYDIKIDLKKGAFTLGPIVVSEEKTSFFRILASAYTAGLVTPFTKDNKNQYNDGVIKWFGQSLDFTKIKDDKNGTATFGKKNPVVITNK